MRESEVAKLRATRPGRAPQATIPDVVPSLAVNAATDAPVAGAPGNDVSKVRAPADVP